MLVFKGLLKLIDILSYLINLLIRFKCWRLVDKLVKYKKAYLAANLRKFYYNQYNDKGQQHGTWELILGINQIVCRGKYINGIPNGVWEYYRHNGKLANTGKYYFGTEYGLWEYFDINSEKVNRTEFYI